MRKLLKAGLIISIICIALFVGLAVMYFVLAATETKEPVIASYIGSGVTCIFWVGFSIFATIVSSKAISRFDSKQVSIALCVFVIISGCLVNVVNIPAGILMIINRDKINK